MSLKRQLGIVLVFFWIVTAFCSCSIQLDERIFSDINECKNIEKNIADDASVVYYDSPQNDAAFDGFKYTRFVGYKYTSKAFSFDFFAYEFADSDTAKEYFLKASGRESKKDVNFLGVGGTLSYQKVVIEENKAYMIYCSSADKDKVEEKLREIFHSKLEIGAREGSAR